MRAPDGWELAGNVGVDSGTLMIGDPCYLDGGFDYSEWCESIDYENGDGICPGPSDFAKPGEGLTFAASTAYGDGLYSVYVKRDHGRIVAMMVITDEDYEDDDA